MQPAFSEGKCGMIGLYREADVAGLLIVNKASNSS